jgi:hypothetical protein
MGFSWDYVSGAFGLHHKLSTGKVWLNGMLSKPEKIERITLSFIA